jgi:hypothetical protein
MIQPKRRSSVRPPLQMRWAASETSGAKGELSRELDATREALAAAEAKLAAVEAAHARCDEQIRELSLRNSNLVQLTVASQLLCAGSDREDVLNAIEEIIINMIGSEEIAILEHLPGEGKVRLTRTRGIDGRSPRFARAVEPIREAISTGHVVLPRGREITAVIPLRLETTLFGVVAVFRLLEQKPALDELDHELMELLGRQGAVAIFSTAFRSTQPTVRPPSGVMPAAANAGVPETKGTP